MTTASARITALRIRAGRSPGEQNTLATNVAPVPIPRSSPWRFIKRDGSRALREVERRGNRQVTNENQWNQGMSFKSFAVGEFQDQSVASVALHQARAYLGSVREQDSAGPDQDQGAAA